MGLGVALWASPPSRRDRLASLPDLLDGRRRSRRAPRVPDQVLGAWLGTALYWIADIAAFYAALRTVGLHLGVDALILAYATGNAATRRSLYSPEPASPRC